MTRVNTSVYFGKFIITGLPEKVDNHGYGNAILVYHIPYKLIGDRDNLNNPLVTKLLEDYIISHRRREIEKEAGTKIKNLYINYFTLKNPAVVVVNRKRNG